MSDTSIVAITIRGATLADLPQLQGVFERAAWSNEGDRGVILEHPDWLVLSDTGVREGRTRVAVDRSDSVVGFATYLISAGVAELEDLFVDVAWRRQRVGEALVLDMSEIVRGLDLSVLEVTANPHASRFYEHMGFVIVGTVNTEGYPANRMARSIAP
jgi:ribosomal protein S18 acetylase RimI-like enzyme